MWINIDFTARNLIIPEILNRLKWLNVCTKTFKIKGDCHGKSYSKILERKDAQQLYIQSFAKIIKSITEKCPLIEEVRFESCFFDWFVNFKIDSFPKNLKKLELINCRGPVERASKIFTGIDKHLSHLEEIRIDYCNWLEIIDIMQFSKLTNLKKLSMKGCKKFDNSVPYLSLSCKFGFKSLEVLDLRETNIADSELTCFNAVTSLKELYLEGIPGDESQAESEEPVISIEDVLNKFPELKKTATNENPSNVDIGSLMGSPRIISIELNCHLHRDEPPAAASRQEPEEERNGNASESNGGPSNGRAAEENQPGTSRNESSTSNAPADNTSNPSTSRDEGPSNNENPADPQPGSSNVANILRALSGIRNAVGDAVGDVGPAVIPPIENHRRVIIARIFNGDADMPSSAFEVRTSSSNREPQLIINHEFRKCKFNLRKFTFILYFFYLWFFRHFAWVSLKLF